MENYKISEYFTEVPSETDDIRVCCDKCQAHGITKIFIKKDEQLLKDHLLEHHGTLVINFIPDSPLSSPKLLKNEKDDNDSYEYFVVAEEVATSDHLNEDAHGEGEELSFTSNIKRKSLNSSPVWKYFCRPMKGLGTVDAFVYCKVCINSEVITRYRHRSSTTTLRNHLSTKHNIELDDCKEEFVDLQISPQELLEKIKFWEETLAKQRTVHEDHERPNRYESNARRYFGVPLNNKTQFYCLLCKQENNQQHLYSRQTSTSTMKRHLINMHNFNPDLEKVHVEDPNQGGISKEIKSIAVKRMLIRTHVIWNYFIPINDSEDNLYCVFCLSDNMQRSYRKTTSATNLRTHLEKRHYFSLPAKSTASTAAIPEQDLKSHKKIAQCQVDGEVMMYAQDLIKVRKLPLHEYFIQIEDEIERLLCAFCAAKGIKKIYEADEDENILLAHLEDKHCFSPAQDMVVEDEEEELYLDEEILEDQQEIEEEEIIQEEPSTEETPHEPAQLVEISEDDEDLFKPPPVKRKKITQKKYCRACGKSDGTFFTKITGGSCLNADESVPISLSDAYFMCTGVRVHVDDEKSQLICYLCEANLKTAFQFRKLANETETSCKEENDAMKNDQFIVSFCDEG